MGGIMSPMPALLVVALAIALRVVWVLLVPTKPVGDFAMYLESAAYLAEHHELDPEFIFMPGYVLLLTPIQILGGGWLAAKILGAVIGGLGAGAVYGIARQLWDSVPVALVAGLMCALWPAGIAIASVTGTDMPAAVAIAGAIYVLVRLANERPTLAAILFGVMMGIATWIRAVALPLTVLSVFFLRARSESWKGAVARAGLACLAALVVLAPWVVRNQFRYGETVLTDSHGGLTALVGANPDSDGTYSRSLNRMFKEATGYTVLGEPHRAVDRKAYELAREWTIFSPMYALGLVVGKAERLLDNERALLYWPLYRAGVLRDGKKQTFDDHRRQLETVVDWFWRLLIGAGLVGLAVAGTQQRWELLSFVPMQLALIGLYAAFFAEARYHLPIAFLLFPAAGGALVWLAEAPRRLWRERLLREVVSEVMVGAVVVAGVFLAWPCVTAAGESWRETHRWAVHVCRAEGKARLCKWYARVGGPDQSPLVGVWNGLGLALGRQPVGAETELVLPGGTYRIRAAVDQAPLSEGALKGSASFSAGDAVGKPIDMAEIDRASRVGDTVPVEIEVEHPGGPLTVRFEAQLDGDEGPGTRIWLGELEVTAR